MVARTCATSPARAGTVPDRIAATQYRRSRQLRHVDSEVAQRAGDRDVGGPDPAVVDLERHRPAVGQRRGEDALGAVLGDQARDRCIRAVAARPVPPTSSGWLRMASATRCSGPVAAGGDPGERAGQAGQADARTAARRSRRRRWPRSARRQLADGAGQRLLQRVAGAR